MHVHRWNHATQGRSKDNSSPFMTTVMELHNQDFPVTTLNRDDGNEVNNADGPMLIAFGVPCL